MDYDQILADQRRRHHLRMMRQPLYFLAKGGRVSHAINISDGAQRGSSYNPAVPVWTSVCGRSRDHELLLDDLGRPVPWEEDDGRSPCSWCCHAIDNRDRWRAEVLAGQHDDDIVDQS